LSGTGTDSSSGNTRAASSVARIILQETRRRADLLIKSEGVRIDPKIMNNVEKLIMQSTKAKAPKINALYSEGRQIGKDDLEETVRDLFGFALRTAERDNRRNLVENDFRVALDEYRRTFGCPWPLSLLW